jgi:hypothetical protein
LAQAKTWENRVIDENVVLTVNFKKTI